jgi:hypothetical protein
VSLGFIVLGLSDRGTGRDKTGMEVERELRQDGRSETGGKRRRRDEDQRGREGLG